MESYDESWEELSEIDIEFIERKLEFVKDDIKSVESRIKSLSSDKEKAQEENRGRFLYNNNAMEYNAAEKYLRSGGRRPQSPPPPITRGFYHSDWSSVDQMESIRDAQNSRAQYASDFLQYSTQYSSWESFHKSSEAMQARETLSRYRKEVEQDRAAYYRNDSLIDDQLKKTHGWTLGELYEEKSRLYQEKKVLYLKLKFIKQKTWSEYHGGYDRSYGRDSNSENYSVEHNSYTRMCKFFNGRDGSCRNGNDCKFSHDVEFAQSGSYYDNEPRQKSYSSSGHRNNSNSYKKSNNNSQAQLCKFFDGSPSSCRNGDDCRFSHDINFNG